MQCLTHLNKFHTSKPLQLYNVAAHYLYTACRSSHATIHPNRDNSLNPAQKVKPSAATEQSAPRSNKNDGNDNDADWKRDVTAHVPQPNNLHDVDSGYGLSRRGLIGRLQHITALHFTDASKIIWQQKKTKFYTEAYLFRLKLRYKKAAHLAEIQKSFEVERERIKRDVKIPRGSVAVRLAKDWDFLISCLTKVDLPAAAYLVWQQAEEVPFIQLDQITLAKILCAYLRQNNFDQIKTIIQQYQANHILLETDPAVIPAMNMRPGGTSTAAFEQRTIHRRWRPRTFSDNTTQQLQQSQSQLEVIILLNQLLQHLFFLTNQPHKFIVAQNLNHRQCLEDLQRLFISFGAVFTVSTYEWIMKIQLNLKDTTEAIETYSEMLKQEILPSADSLRRFATALHETVEKNLLPPQQAIEAIERCIRNPAMVAILMAARSANSQQRSSEKEDVDYMISAVLKLCISVADFSTLDNLLNSMAEYQLNLRLTHLDILLNFNTEISERFVPLIERAINSQRFDELLSAHENGNSLVKSIIRAFLAMNSYKTAIDFFIKFFTSVEKGDDSHHSTSEAILGRITAFSLQNKNSEALNYLLTQLEYCKYSSIDTYEGIIYCAEQLNQCKYSLRAIQALENHVYKPLNSIIWNFLLRSLHNASHAESTSNSTQNFDASSLSNSLGSLGIADSFENVVKLSDLPSNFSEAQLFLLAKKHGEVGTVRIVQWNGEKSAGRIVYLQENDARAAQKALINFGSSLERNQSAEEGKMNPGGELGPDPADSSPSQASAEDLAELAHLEERYLHTAWLALFPQFKANQAEVTIEFSSSSSFRYAGFLGQKFHSHVVLENLCSLDLFFLGFKQFQAEFNETAAITLRFIFLSNDQDFFDKKAGGVLYRRYIQQQIPGKMRFQYFDWSCFTIQFKPKEWSYNREILPPVLKTLASSHKQRESYRESEGEEERA
jgi:hypothetical protein